MARVVILIGPPGAGKGTQAAMLSRELRLPHVSTGDLFRENLGAGTPLGLRAKEFVESGRLVPDDLVVDMLFDHVDRDDCRGGYLLDGFPRTVSQAETLEGRLASSGDPQPWETRVVMLEVPDEVLVRRIGGRLVCEACGSVQHMESSPPREADRCDACGGELVQRKDDRPAIVRKRLTVYHEQTDPVVEYYRSQDRLCSVDGDREPAAVFEACMACVG